uniref:Uncharacterized protein n=1 Tax=Schizaphis graminum TaxID=13262 RepID=A0A2S2PS10_SCHGA
MYNRVILTYPLFFSLYFQNKSFGCILIMNHRFKNEYSTVHGNIKFRSIIYCQRRYAWVGGTAEVEYIGETPKIYIFIFTIFNQYNNCCKCKFLFFFFTNKRKSSQIYRCLNINNKINVHPNHPIIIFIKLF